MKSAIKTSEKDNIAVLLTDAWEEEDIQIQNMKGEKLKIIKSRNNIKYLHKIALLNIPSKSDIIKYGETVGYSKKYIRKGDLVHTNNMASTVP